MKNNFLGSLLTVIQIILCYIILIPKEQYRKFIWQKKMCGFCPWHSLDNNVLILFRKQIEFLTQPRIENLQCSFHSGNLILFDGRNIIAFLLAKKKWYEKIHLHIQCHALRIVFEFSINPRHSKRCLTSLQSPCKRLYKFLQCLKKKENFHSWWKWLEDKND